MAETTTTAKRHAWLPDFGGKGWGVVILCMVFYYCYNVFDAGLNAILAVYAELYGWSNVSMTSSVTLGGWISIIGILLFGAICKKRGVKLTAALGLFGAAVFAVVLAFASTYPLFMVGVIGFLFCNVGFAQIGVGQFGANWFPRKTGLFMGIATAGLTISAATLNYLILGVAGAFGIKTFFLGFAAVMAIVGIITLVAFKSYPEEAGAYPDNDKTLSREVLDRERALAEEHRKNSKYTLKKVLSMKETWLVAIGYSLPMMCASGFLGQMAFGLASYGHDFMFGIAILSGGWPVGIIASIVLGMIDDKWGTRTASILMMILVICGMLMITFFGASVPVAIVGGCIMLAAAAGITNITVSMSTTIFGRREFENFWPTISVIYKLIVASGATLVALIAAAAGFQVCYGVLAVICVIALIIMVVLKNECVTDDEIMERQLF